MLIESLSGVRAHDKELTDKFVSAYAQAFADMIGGAKRVVIGRDTRVSGTRIKDTIIETLRRIGIKVVDLGICPTPTVQFQVAFQQAQGGIVVTASHNPLPWNGLKFLNAAGIFLNGDQMRTLQKKRKKFVRQSLPEATEKAALIDYVQGIEDHIRSTLFLPYINQDRIKARRIKVVIDAVNGAGYQALPQLLKALGCQVVQLNCQADKPFPRSPEPLPENLSELTQKVTETEADIGLTVDPDADRLAIVSDQGKPISEEYTLVLASKLVLSKAVTDEKRIVTNLSTTMAIDDLAQQYNAQVIRTPIGEINVAEKMQQVNALIGGEGNGGVILPDSHLGRDSLVGTALILQLLAEMSKPLSKIMENIPRYHMIKQKAPLDNIKLDAERDNLKQLAKPESIDIQDGIKFIYKDRWVHMRPSNTEPIIRIYAEARTEQQARKSAQPFIDYFKDKDQNQ